MQMTLDKKEREEGEKGNDDIGHLANQGKLFDRNYMMEVYCD